MGDEKETLFYRDNRGVRITSSEVTVGDKTYPMLNIRTVSMATLPPNRSGPMWGVVLSLGAGAAGIPSQAWLISLTGIILAMLCIWWMMRLRPRYSLVLGGLNGSIHAVTSPDKKYIQTLQHAMDEVFTQLAGRLC